MLLLYAQTTNLGVTLALRGYSIMDSYFRGNGRTVDSIPVLRRGEFSHTCNGWHSIVVLIDAFINRLKAEEKKKCQASSSEKWIQTFFLVSFLFIFWWWKYNLMCTKKLERIQVTETFTSLRVCACGCICVNIYMYTCGRHTPTVDLFKINLYADLSGRRLCQNWTHPHCSFCTCERGYRDANNDDDHDDDADNVTLWF